MKHILLFALALLAAQVAQTQTTSIKFINAPTNAILKLDGNAIEVNKAYEVIQGEHFYEVWQNEIRTYRSAFYQLPNRSSVIDLELILPNQEDFRKNLALYQGLKFGSRYLVPIVSLAIFTPQIVKLRETKKLMDGYYSTAISKKEVYESAYDLAEISLAKKSYNSAKANYYESFELYRERRNKTIWLGVGLAGTIALFQLVAVNLKRPSYTEMVGLTLVPNEYSQTANLGIEINVPIK